MMFPYFYGLLEIKNIYCRFCSIFNYCQTIPSNIFVFLKIHCLIKQDVFLIYSNKILI